VNTVSALRQERLCSYTGLLAWSTSSTSLHLFYFYEKFFVPVFCGFCGILMTQTLIPSKRLDSCCAVIVSECCQHFLHFMLFLFNKTENCLLASKFHFHEWKLKQSWNRNYKTCFISVFIWRMFSHQCSQSV